MMEFINWYLDSVSVFFDGVSAFFVSLASGGLFQLILLWFLISCIFRRRWGWRDRRGNGDDQDLPAGTIPSGGV